MYTYDLTIKTDDNNLYNVAQKNVATQSQITMLVNISMFEHNVHSPINNYNTKNKNNITTTHLFNNHTTVMRMK